MIFGNGNSDKFLFIIESVNCTIFVFCFNHRKCKNYETCFKSNSFLAVSNTKGTNLDLLLDVHLVLCINVFLYFSLFQRTCLSTGIPS